MHAAHRVRTVYFRRAGSTSRPRRAWHLDRSQSTIKSPKWVRLAGFSQGVTPTRWAPTCCCCGAGAPLLANSVGYSARRGEVGMAESRERSPTVLLPIDHVIVCQHGRHFGSTRCDPFRLPPMRPCYQVGVLATSFSH